MEDKDQTISSSDVPAQPAQAPREAAPQNAGGECPAGGESRPDNAGGESRQGGGESRQDAGGESRQDAGDKRDGGRRRRGRRGRRGRGSRDQRQNRAQEGVPAEGGAERRDERGPERGEERQERGDNRERGEQRQDRGERGDNRDRGGQRGERRDDNRDRGGKRDDQRDDQREERRIGKRDNRRGKNRVERRHDHQSKRGQRGRRGRERHGDAGERPMDGKREMIANTSREETRVAINENDRLVELLWERRESRSIVGNIYKGRIENVLPGISSAFINIGFDKNAYLYISDVLGDSRKPIDQLLKKGQDVMLQVAKEAIGTKGMKVTMEVTLPGRYLVLSPMTQSIGISKHISDGGERKRISEIINKLAQETLKGLGVVVRTEAEGASEDELVREAEYLVKTWNGIREKFDAEEPPTRLHEEMDLPMQVARDLLNEDVYVYLIDNKEVFARVTDYIGQISPELKERVRYYDGKTPVFTAFNIEPEIEKLRQTKVQLPSGGTIVIQEAESLCAIDVNTGRFTGSKTQEETVTLNNIEAAQEVAHQLRLRNIGGIIVIDFIDMRKASNRQKVMEAFQEAVRNDRAKIRILPITRLGLIEMTRERRRESTISLMTDECPECMGSGRVFSAESMRVRVEREINELTQGREGADVRLVLHPQLADVFRDKQKRIEENIGRGVKISADANLQWEDYRIILE